VEYSSRKRRFETLLETLALFGIMTPQKKKKRRIRKVSSPLERRGSVARFLPKPLELSQGKDAPLSSHATIRNEAGQGHQKNVWTFPKYREHNWSRKPKCVVFRLLQSWGSSEPCRITLLLLPSTNFERPTPAASVVLSG